MRTPGSARASANASAAWASGSAMHSSCRGGLQAAAVRRPPPTASRGRRASAPRAPARSAATARRRSRRPGCPGGRASTCAARGAGPGHRAQEQPRVLAAGQLQDGVGMVVEERVHVARAAPSPPRARPRRDSRPAGRNGRWNERGIRPRVASRARPRRASGRRGTTCARRAAIRAGSARAIASRSRSVPRHAATARPRSRARRSPAVAVVEVPEAERVGGGDERVLVDLVDGREERQHLGQAVAGRRQQAADLVRRELVLAPPGVAAEQQRLPARVVDAPGRGREAGLLGVGGVGDADRRQGGPQIGPSPCPTCGGDGDEAVLRARHEGAHRTDGPRARIRFRRCAACC